MPFLSKFLFSGWNPTKKSHWISAEDILLSFFTGYYEKGRLELHHRRSGQNSEVVATKNPTPPRKLTCQFWKMFTILWRISLWVPFEPASNMEWSFTRCSLASYFDHCSSKAKTVFLPHSRDEFSRTDGIHKKEKKYWQLPWTHSEQTIFLAGKCTHLTNMEMFFELPCFTPRLYDSPRLAAVCWKNRCF